MRFPIKVPLEATVAPESGALLESATFIVILSKLTPKASAVICAITVLSKICGGRGSQGQCRSPAQPDGAGEKQGNDATTRCNAEKYSI